MNPVKVRVRIKVGSLENGREGVKKVKSGNSNKVGGPKTPLEIMDKNGQYEPAHADEHVSVSPFLADVGSFLVPKRDLFSRGTNLSTLALNGLNVNIM